MDQPAVINKNIKIRKVVLIITMLIVLVGGGLASYFIVYKEKTSDQKTESTNAKSDTSGWQTYSNKLYGYSFDYPVSKWEVDEKDESDIKLNRRIRQDATLQSGLPLISEFKAEITDETDENVWINSELSDIDFKSEGFILGGKEAIMVTRTSSDQKIIKEIFLIADKVGYRIISGNNLDDFEAVVSTFKLISKSEPNSQPTEQISSNTVLTQTYTNEKYGFSLKYPDKWVASEPEVSGHDLFKVNFYNNIDEQVFFTYSVTDRKIDDEIKNYKTLIGQENIVSQEDYSLDIYKGKKIKISKDSAESTAIFLTRNNYTYSISGVTMDPAVKTNLYFSQMISSINFLKL